MVYTRENSETRKVKIVIMIFYYILLFLSTYFLVKIIIEEITAIIILNRISYNHSLNEFIKFSKEESKKLISF